VKAHLALGVLRRAAGRPVEMEEGWRRGVAVYERLVDRFPDNAHYRYELGNYLHGLAARARQRDDRTEARRLFERAIEQQLVVLNADPSSTSSVFALRGHYKSLAETLLELGEHAAAAEAATRMANLRWVDWNTRYQAAVLVARCIPLAEKDDRLSSEQRQTQAEAYASRAVSLIRQTLRDKGVEVDRLRKEPAFEPLRHRTDFQALFPK
jgi:tetratricopeptide (TPR) repeat protein